MTDENFTPPRPAMPVAPTDLPSRAAEAPKSAPAPMFDEALVPAPKSKRNQSKRRGKANMKKRHTARPASNGPAKNLNRPLEMKNQLAAVLAMTGALRKTELVTFSGMVQQLARMTRRSRRRVIEALGQVYP